MQAITPQDVHHDTYHETYKAGTHFKYLDDLPAMKTLQDSYRYLFDYDPLALYGFVPQLAASLVWLTRAIC